jgi:hypothetical protein
MNSYFTSAGTTNILQVACCFAADLLFVGPLLTAVFSLGTIFGKMQLNRREGVFKA